MNDILIMIISFILIIAGLVGTLLPILPGLLLSIFGLLLYKFGTNANLSMIYIWIFVLLTITSVILNYIIPAKTTTKYGGTRWGSIGSFIGTIIGMFLPIPLGFLIGMFAGVFVGEMLHDHKDHQKALNSTKGAFIGFIYGTGFSFMVGLAIFLVVLFNLFNII